MLQRAVPDSAINLGARCVSVSTTDSSAAITLENGKQIEGDVVIGADGVRSRIRAVG
jgi:salicylate hydroxylase